MDFTPTDFDAPLAEPQRRYLQAELGKEMAQVFWRRQVHEDTVVTAIGGPGSCASFGEADAFVTNQRGLPLAIRTADCVPVFIVDPVHKAIGLVHAGWKGTLKQIAPKTVKTMEDKYGSQCYDLKIVLGPAIRACCYQVGEEFETYFPDDVKERDQALYLDMASVLRRQLTDLGVPDSCISDSHECTCCNRRYFSYRRDGAKAGRMISLMEIL